MMQIYNTQTRRKEEFVPIEPGKFAFTAAARRFTTISISAMRARLSYSTRFAAIWNTRAMRSSMSRISPISMIR